MTRRPYRCACHGCVVRSLAVAMSHLSAGRPRVAFDILDLLIADLLPPTPSLCPRGRHVLAGLLDALPSARRRIAA
jgi:hypothetical protein